ncbi:MAG TPA: SprT family zinc-dependent metalloprotease [Rhodocyclaceae bacterium]
MAPKPLSTPLQIELPLWSVAEPPPAPKAGDSLRRLLIGDQWVTYRLRRGRRRRLTLTVDADGLRIGAPLSLPLQAIEGFAASHHDWIVRKLGEWQARSRRTLVAVADGIAIPVLGRQLLLRVVPGARCREWSADQLRLPATGDLPAALETALREHARSHFQARVVHYTSRLGVAAPPLSIGAARTRWGSCSRAGIRLNWRLIHFRALLVDYVIAHEVAHLREMNHGPRFWKLVGTLFPDYAACRAALREEADALPIYR